MMNPNTNLAAMKWNEIPAETPITELMAAVGFPEPMVILKHLAKPRKDNKKVDLNALIQIMWLTKGEIDEFITIGYQNLIQSSKVRKFMLTHPKQSLHMMQFIQQVQDEPISTIAERTLNVWVKQLVEEEVWNNLMQETPLTLLEKIIKTFTDTNYLNMTLGEYYEKLELEATLKTASIKAIGDYFVKAEEREKREKEFEALLASKNMDALFNMFMGNNRSPFDLQPNVDTAEAEDTEN